MILMKKRKTEEKNQSFMIFLFVSFFVCFALFFRWDNDITNLFGN